MFTCIIDALKRSRSTESRLSDVRAGLELLLMYPAAMSATFQQAIPILPAADVQASIDWWTKICGFTVSFTDHNPPTYAGLERDGSFLHLAAMADKQLARTVGDQTMVRFAVKDIQAFYLEFKDRGGPVHPNGGLQTRPWGTEFSAIDPNGVCVTFLAV